MVSLNTNVQAMNAIRLINNNNAQLQKTTERLSSGLRINTASDDPAGMAIVQTMTAKIRGDQQGLNNIQQGVSALQIAESGLSAIADQLQRMRELTVQAASDLLTADQRTAIEAELDAIATSITSISDSVTFNGRSLLDGSIATALEIQFGSETASATTLATTLFADRDATALSVADANMLVDTTNNAQLSQALVDTAIQTISTARTNIGAAITQLEALGSAQETNVVATTAARSRIQDADVALEVSNLVRQQILQQAGASALASANFAPQFVLALLQ